MSEPSDSLTQGLTSPITSEIMVGIVVILFLLFLILFFLYLYAKRYRGANPTMRPRTSRIHFILPPDHNALPRRGLDPAVIRSLPVTVFTAESGIECAVCISEITVGEEARILPTCAHGFHLECIDMWFHSNNTCPLCRSPLCSAPKRITDLREQVLELGIQGSGDGEEGSSSGGSCSGKRLVIEIPRRGGDGDGFAGSSSPLPLSRQAVEGMRSPMSARLRSLGRMLSRGSRGSGPSYSPIGGDIV